MLNKLFNRSDEKLVKKFIQSRDESVFRELYRRHTPALYAMALRLVGGLEADAQDAVQETWIRACKRFSTFEWRSSLKTWLIGILINRARELSREKQHHQAEELQDQDAGHVTIQPFNGIDVERAIGDLPTGYRHVLVLHDVEGYTHDEIGKLLGISVGTSKSQLFHARKTLRSKPGWSGSNNGTRI